MVKRKISMDNAILEYKRIDSLYKGEVSLGVRMGYGISQKEYFTNTWNLNPKQYIRKNKNLLKILNPIFGRAALLAAAPRLWADRVLQFLDLDTFFANNIYTGEPFLRKPNPLIFQKIANDLKTETHSIISIGDQEITDILPAKSAGMVTLKVGDGLTCAEYQAKDTTEAITLLEKEGHI